MNTKDPGAIRLSEAPKWCVRRMRSDSNTYDTERWVVATWAHGDHNNSIALRDSDWRAFKFETALDAMAFFGRNRSKIENMKDGEWTIKGVTA